jgi:hypothetical protein
LTWQCKDGEAVEVAVTGTGDTTTTTDKVTAPEPKKAKTTKSATSKVKARDTKKKKAKPKAKVRATLGAVKRVALSPLKAHANKKQRVETLVFSDDDSDWVKSPPPRNRTRKVIREESSDECDSENSPPRKRKGNLNRDNDSEYSPYT